MSLTVPGFWSALEMLWMLMIRLSMSVPMALFLWNLEYRFREQELRHDKLMRNKKSD